MTIDEARNDIRSAEKEIQKILVELQSRIDLSIDDISVKIIKLNSISKPSANSYIGRVKISVVI